MSALQTLKLAIEEEPSLEGALAALLEGLAREVKATSNDQNAQKLAREMRIAAPGLVAALAGKRAER